LRTPPADMDALTLVDYQLGRSLVDAIRQQQAK
jgi:hypothetical protein